MASLPSYQDLTAHPASEAEADTPSAGGTRRPQWLADAVLASRMQFMLSILVPCTPHFGQVCCLSTRTPGLRSQLRSSQGRMHPQATLTTAVHALQT